MNSKSPQLSCQRAEDTALYAVGALPSEEMHAAARHISSCEQCRQDLNALRTVTDSFVSWPTAVLRPAPSVWKRLTERISAEANTSPEPPDSGARLDLQWEEAAPGISYKLLTIDAERDRVSMLVRLAPGVEYPPHMHAEFEELHLLDGELWIDDRKLFPGDFNRAEPGTSDRLVWSETGCTCFLSTSLRDVLA